MEKYNKILIVRTDRIGDVILSTPVIKVIKEAYPQSWLAFMLRPYAADVLVDNPYLDEIIIYDKYNKHRSWFASYQFAQLLKKKQFDAAIILHPSNRAHIITYLAGIVKRVGYDKNFGFLLTNRIKDRKADGLKHEAEYNFDLLKLLNIFEESKETCIKVSKEDTKFVGNLLLENDIKENDKFIVIHPAASCSSKVWPQNNFIEVAQQLLNTHKVKIILICSQEHLNICQSIYEKLPPEKAIIFNGLKLKHIAALFKRAVLLISNDSGPVHIAVAVGCPVVDIFGRNQPGLSPKRWGPLDKKSIVLHKPENCQPCLAHNCLKKYKCLQNITVEDVVNAAEKLFKDISN
jgi:lipopolysaccharide heptosyltransferase II